MIDVEHSKVVKMGRVSPGKMFLVDTEAGRILECEEVTAAVASSNTWHEWVKVNLFDLDDLPDPEPCAHTATTTTHRT